MVEKTLIHLDDSDTVTLGNIEFDPDEALPDEDCFDDDYCYEEDACEVAINPRYSGPGSWDRPFDNYPGVISTVIRLESSYG